MFCADVFSAPLTIWIHQLIFKVFSKTVTSRKEGLRHTRYCYAGAYVGMWWKQGKGRLDLELACGDAPLHHSRVFAASTLQGGLLQKRTAHTHRSLLPHAHIVADKSMIQRTNTKVHVILDILRCTCFLLVLTRVRNEGRYGNGENFEDLPNAKNYTLLPRELGKLSEFRNQRSVTTLH